MDRYQDHRRLVGQDARDARDAFDAAMATCCQQTCEAGPLSANRTPVPHAWVRYMPEDNIFLNGGCPSNGAWYNPISKTIVGRAHCTCDRCF